MAVVSIRSEIHPGDVIPKKRSNIGLLYLNGILSVESSFPHLDRCLYKKNWIGHAHVYFDELRIYNDIRPESSIRKLMIRRLEVGQRSIVNSLVLYMGFDDGVQQLSTGKSYIHSRSSQISSVSETEFILKNTKHHPAWQYTQDNAYLPLRDKSYQMTRNMGFTVGITVQSHHNKVEVLPTISVKMLEPETTNLACDMSTDKYIASQSMHQGAQEPVSGTCRMEYQSKPYVCQTTSEASAAKGKWCTDTTFRYHSNGVQTYEFDIVPIVSNNRSFISQEHSLLIGEKKGCKGQDIPLWSLDGSDARFLLRGTELYDACFQACLDQFDCFVYKMGRDAYIGACVMETLIKGRTTCTKPDGASNIEHNNRPNYDLYQMKRQTVKDTFVTPFSLLSLWTFDDGHGTTFPSDLSYGDQEEQLRVDWQHTDWVYDIDRGVSIEMDGYSKAVANITGECKTSLISFWSSQK